MDDENKKPKKKRAALTRAEEFRAADEIRRLWPKWREDGTPRETAAEQVADAIGVPRDRLPPDTLYRCCVDLNLQAPACRPKPRGLAAQGAKNGGPTDRVKLLARAVVELYTDLGKPVPEYLKLMSLGRRPVDADAGPLFGRQSDK